MSNTILRDCSKNIPHFVADSSVSPTGLKWAAPAGGGKVLQVVSSVTTTETTISSTSYTDSAITGTITPTSASSKILVLISYNGSAKRDALEVASGAQVLRGATVIAQYQDYPFVHSRATGATSVRIIVTGAIAYLDSPATTSALTYKLQGKLDSTANSAELTFQTASSPGSIILMEIGA